jgi:YihY family inner membrane protein
LGRRWAGLAGGYAAVLESWPVRGFRETGAGHLASIVAYNALVALVPTSLLLVSVAGLLLRDDRVLATAIRAAYWALPSRDAADALEAALAARRHSGWFAAASVLGFAWVGTNFVGALNHCLNRVYGVPDCGFVCTRRRGLLAIAGFAVLFSAAALAAALPTLFVGRDVGPYFATWALAAGRAQALSYALAVAAAAALFLLVYRVVPTAGQRLGDVWPGALVAAGLFVGLGQAFPLYLRLVGGANRFGAAFGLVSLLVAWFAALAHVLLFGCYVNASYRRRRGRRRGPPPGP